MHGNENEGNVHLHVQVILNIFIGELLEKMFENLWFWAPDKRSILHQERQ